MEQRIVKTSCPRDCFGGCSMKVHTEDGKIVKLEGDDVNRAVSGKLCAKGLSFADYVYSPNRVKYPMKRKGDRGEGSFERISWEEAISCICGRLNHVKNTYGPEAFMFYSSGGCQGLLNSYYKGFFNQYGGYTTRRGNLCYPAGVEATKLTYGEVKHNVPWDLENAGLIILWGKNPAHTNVQEMRFINNTISKGGKFITIDPIRTASTTKSHLHISPLPGTDTALALCIINLLIQSNSIDKEFIDKYTIGFDLLKDHVKEYTPAKAAKMCGINEEEIHKMVELIEDNKPMTLVCGYGIQRYKNGGQTVRAISMIPALVGDIGVKGGGFRFVNKQWGNISWPFVPEGKVAIRDDYPASSLGRAIENYDNPGIKMLWMERANPLNMHPDVNNLKKAMDKVDYIVVFDQFMTDTAKYADLILPAQSFFEYEDVFSGYWSPYLSYYKKVIEPYYESKNESQVYRMLGEHMGYDMSYLPEYNSDTINYILKYCNIDTNVEKLAEAPHMNKNEIAFADRKFNTPSGRIELYSEDMKNKWGLEPLPVLNPEYSEMYGNTEYPLRLLTTHARERIHSQFADIKALTENDGKALVYMHPFDAESRNMKNDDRVTIYNVKGSIQAHVYITEKIKQGVINVYEGLPEKSGANVNVLTSQEPTDIGWGPTYYDCFVEVKSM